MVFRVYSFRLTAHSQTRFRFGSGNQFITSPEKVTRRFIMQRRHAVTQQSISRACLGAWFRDYFTPLFEVLFHLSLHFFGTFPIGLSGVFSLTGWARQIHAGFLVSRRSQDNTRLHLASYTQLSCSASCFQNILFTNVYPSSDYYNPDGAVTPTVQAIIPVLSSMLGIIIIFCSCKY